MKVGAYVRVSTTMQEEKNSLKTQIKKIESYCDLHDYELYKIYEDVDSGTNDERIGFKTLLKDIKKKNFDIVLVYESSRISRKTHTMMNFVFNLIEKDIKFISISQPDLNTTTSTGRLFFTIQAGLAQYEREQISARVKSSAYEKASKGEWMGGQLPIGYVWDGDRKNKKIKIDKRQAELVKAYFDTFIENRSLKRTSKLFNRKLESLRWILTNPFYAGKYRFGVKKKNIVTGIRKKSEDYILSEGTHKGIITIETFNTVQKILKNSRAIDYDNKNGSTALFGGLIKCICGHKMFGNKIDNKAQGGKVYHYYMCDTCGKRINAGKIEEKVLTQITEVDKLKEVNQVDNYMETVERQIQIFENRKDILTKENNNLINMLKKELIAESEYIKSRKENVNDLKVIDKEIEILEKIKSKENDNENRGNYELLREVLENYEEYEPIQLKELFRVLIQEIEIVDSRSLEYNIIFNLK
ncbi:MAG: recombinase family protein [Psychrilyobacter sp.]|uniref:recombinase family protein n=1 Tax=Psychrilyobacter sp. TaxID=2586924 RepID=UPI003C709AFB